MKIGTAILNFLTGGLVQRVLDYFIARDTAKLNAMNEAEKLAFDERQTERQNRRDVRLATANFWEQRVIAFLIALPFVIHVNLVGLDTNFLNGTMRVPKFPAPFDEWEGAILLSFFGITAGVGVAKSVVAAGVLRARSTGKAASQKPP